MELKEICSSTFYYRQVAAGLVLAAVTATSQGAMASDPQAAHLAQCKSELQALYGPETRLRMIKAKMAFEKMTGKPVGRNEPEEVKVEEKASEKPEAVKPPPVQPPAQPPAVSTPTEEIKKLAQTDRDDP